MVTKYMKYYFLISLLVLAPGIFSLLRFGLLPSIDFTGGSVLIVSGKSGEATYHYPPMDLDEKNKILAEMQKNDETINEKSFESIGASLGKELVRKTITAVAICVLLITLYLGWRFASLKYGVSAAMALAHDALVVLGVFSLLGVFLKVQVDVLFVSALLTMLSFSVHDTIIVFDRLREFGKLKTGKSYEVLIDESAKQTINRSLRNSLAVIFMLLMVFLLTSGSLHWFVLALLVGTITGTYSSTCVALPLLVVWRRVGKM